MSRLRLYRAWKWWRAFGYPENNENGDLLRSLSTAQRIRIAWYWSSDKAAYDSAPRRPR